MILSDMNIKTDNHDAGLMNLQRSSNRSMSFCITAGMCIGEVVIGNQKARLKHQRV